LNTYLIFLRFELMRGNLSRERYADEVERVKVYLRAAPEPHFAEFMRVWDANVGEAPSAREALP
jgi:hypothetical protein